MSHTHTALFFLMHAPVEADDPAVASLGAPAAAAYARLEACLAQHDRAWGACQKGVRERGGIGRSPLNLLPFSMRPSHTRTHTHTLRGRRSARLHGTPAAAAAKG